MLFPDQFLSQKLNTNALVKLIPIQIQSPTHPSYTFPLAHSLSLSLSLTHTHTHSPPHPPHTHSPARSLSLSLSLPHTHTHTHTHTPIRQTTKSVSAVQV